MNYVKTKDDYWFATSRWLSKIILSRALHVTNRGVKFLRRLALALCIGLLCCHCAVTAAAGARTPNQTANLTGHVYRDTKYGFQMVIPPGWQAREKSFPAGHYAFTFLTVNNQRPGLVFEGGFGATWLFNNHVTQLQPGEAYISIGYEGGPMGATMGADNVGEDLRSLLATHQVRTFSSRGVSYYELNFLKRGQHWSISASMKEPVSKENRRKFMAMLQSFRFVNAPVGNASWAESLAWKELPEKIRDTGDWPFGWPVVGQWGEQSGTGMMGQRSVAITNLGSAYSVTFALQAIGKWRFMVRTNGQVESEPPTVHAEGPPPSRWPSDLPGVSGGKIDSYWVVPYVQASGAFGKTTVTWFAKDGRVERQVTTTDFNPWSGYLEISGHPNTVQGINEDWQITLPRSPSDLKFPGYITSTADSRVLVHERHPKQGQIALDIYIHGKRVNTVGPFWQYSVSDVALNDDGSTAFLITKTNMQSEVPLSGNALRKKLLSNEQVQSQIVALNTNGQIRFKSNCGPAVWDPIVAPDGAGVLLRPNNGTNQNTFMWFTAAGLQRSLKISPNPEFIGWIPKTCQSLFSTSIGLQSGPYELIDWQTGKKVWDIPCPGRGETVAIALTPRLVLFSVAVPYPSGTWHKINESLFQSGKEWVRTFYAVDAQTGKLIARWRGQFPHRYSGKLRDHFLQLGGRLYYVTADDFTELNLKDITAKTHGWQ